MKQYILAAIIALFTPVIASAQFKYISLNRDYDVEDKYSKKEIPVYLRQSDIPNKNYIEIGLIVCKSDRDKKVFNKAKKKAARHGASAIYLVSEQDKTKTDKVLNALLGTGHKDEARFMAIRYE